jgi:hypothetical protein
MARSHFPDLDAIAELANTEIRFYAIVGAVVSLTSALEHRLVDIFQKALGIDAEQAKAMLMDIRASSVQRDLALTAMDFKVRSDTQLAGAWSSLRARVTSTTGGGGERNIVSHNPVSSYVAASGALGGAPLGTLPLGGGIIWEYFVQVPPERLSGKKPPRSADFNSLTRAARALVSLIQDTDTFLNRL